MPPPPQSPNPAHLEYRRELDGLRALAVLPVMFFHAGYAAFSGGFLGVDVFFVISGYLITRLLLADLSQGGISYLRFYERRSRRLLPALFVVTFASFGMAWCLLLPADMKDFSESLVWVSAFAANFHFWQSSGYFETAAEFKPLLHTWSLAVEEQFYLVFPPLLAVLWAFGARRTLFLLALLGVASFAGALLIVELVPATAFYLLPTRAWELLLGAVLAFPEVEQWRNRQTVKPLQEAGALLGCCLIVVSVVVFGRQTPSPGLATLVPCAGAALVILWAGPTTLAGRLLGTRWIVGVGLISYSAYLWHQPLLAFARHRAAGEPAEMMLAGCLAAALGLAWLTWKFVEMPFRNGRLLSSRQLFIFAITGATLMAATGLLGRATEGFSGRFAIKNPDIAALSRITNLHEHFEFPQGVRDKVCHSVPPDALGNNGCVELRKKNILLWGDSYAAALYPGLKRVRDERYPDHGIIQATDGNGPPFLIDGMTADGKSLREANENRIALAATHKPDIVVIAWMVDGRNAPATKDEAHVELHRTVDRILAVSPASKILVVGPFPKWAGSLRNQLVDMHLLTGEPPPARMSRGLVKSNMDWDRFLAKNVPRQQVIYLSSQAALCNADGCLTRIGDAPGQLTAVDWAHLTKAGATHLVRAIQEQVFQ